MVDENTLIFQVSESMKGINKNSRPIRKNGVGCTLNFIFLYLWEWPQSSSDGYN